MFLLGFLLLTRISYASDALSGFVSTGFGAGYANTAAGGGAIMSIQASHVRFDVGLGYRHSVGPALELGYVPFVLFKDSPIFILPTLHGGYTPGAHSDDRHSWDLGNVSLARANYGLSLGADVELRFPGEQTGDTMFYYGLRPGWEWHVSQIDGAPSSGMSFIITMVNSY